MSKTKRYRNHGNRKYKNRKTRKVAKKFYVLPNLTPEYINEVSEVIFKESPKQMPPLANSVAIIDVEGSYSPTVNKELVMLQSIPREKVLDCNNEKAFELKEPLQIGIAGKLFGKTCKKYCYSR